MSFVNYINIRLINRFNECWIVDDKKNRLSGSLSNSSKLYIKTQHLSNLSRFKYFKTMSARFDFLNQSRIILGFESDLKDGYTNRTVDLVKKLYDTRFSGNNFIVTNYETAEMIKYFY